MKLIFYATFVACMFVATETPKINLVFQNLISLGLILTLLLGFIAWVTYIAISVARIKKNQTQAITKSELAEAFEAFRQEIKAR